MTKKTDPATRLAEMGKRRRDAMYADRRQSIALRLLASEGQVSGDDIDAALADEWTEPTDEQLRAALAGKCLAAVAHTRTVVESAEAAIGRAQEKHARAEADVEAAADAVREAEVGAERARAQLAESEALREATGVAPGDPPPPEMVTSANAGVATAKGSI